MKSTNATTGRDRESGFTLVETLVAVVVLIFGLMAVTNLLLVAASSNSVANQGSAATTSATQTMDVLRSTNWNNLVVGGNLAADTTSPSPACNTLANPLVGVYNCDDDIPGVGRIKTRWLISAVPGTVRLLLVTVRSEGTGALSVARSRAEFTTFRACTNSSNGSCGPVPCCPSDP